MKNDELLLAISDMLDKKINPLEKRMDSMEKELKSEIRLVKDEVHVINLKLELDNQLIRSRIQTYDEILGRNQIA